MLACCAEESTAVLCHQPSTQCLPSVLQATIHTYRHFACNQPFLTLACMSRLHRRSQCRFHSAEVWHPAWRSLRCRQGSKEKIESMTVSTCPKKQELLVCFDMSIMIPRYIPADLCRILCSWPGSGRQVPLPAERNGYLSISQSKD